MLGCSPSILTSERLRTSPSDQKWKSGSHWRLTWDPLFVLDYLSNFECTRESMLCDSPKTASISKNRRKEFNHQRLLMLLFLLSRYCFWCRCSGTVVYARWYGRVKSSHCWKPMTGSAVPVVWVIPTPMTILAWSANSDDSSIVLGVLRWEGFRKDYMKSRKGDIEYQRKDRYDNEDRVSKWYTGLHNSFANKFSLWWARLFLTVRLSAIFFGQWKFFNGNPDKNCCLEFSPSIQPIFII